VIGINRYDDPLIPDLRYARADAEAVYAVLTDPAVGRYKPENVVLLLDENATQKKIRSAIGTYLPRKAAKEHTVVVYFAGHGAPVVDLTARSSDGMEKYLVPRDAEAHDLRATGIPMDEIQKYFSWIPANQVVFFIDSCYSGVAGGRTIGQPGFQTKALLTEEFLEHLGDEGRFVVTACGMNEVSLETDAFGHGLFTHYLVEGLKGQADADGNGLVTVDELYNYLSNNVRREAQHLGGSMNPIQKGSVRGRVYLTQYETEIKKRIREAFAAATAAWERNELATARSRWEEVNRLDPDNQEARSGLDRIAEVERRAKKEIERKQGIINRYKHSRDLTRDQAVRAMDLIEKEAVELTGRDARLREHVDELVDGLISPKTYSRFERLIDGEEDGDPPGPRPAPPAPLAVPQVSPTSVNFGFRVASARTVLSISVRNAREEDQAWSFDKTGDFFAVTRTKDGLSLELQSGGGIHSGSVTVTSSGSSTTVPVRAVVLPTPSIKALIGLLLLLGIGVAAMGIHRDWFTGPAGRAGFTPPDGLVSPGPTDSGSTSTTDSVSLVDVNWATGRAKLDYQLDRDKAFLGFYTEWFPPGAGDCSSDDRYDLARHNVEITRGRRSAEFSMAQSPAAGKRSLGINLWTEKNGRPDSLLKSFPQYEHCQ
jgi:hypothetical protein